MATRATNKSKLNTSTAVVEPGTAIEPTPAIGHNQPIVMDDRMIRAIALHAFDDATKSRDFAGSAVQRLCAAVMGQWTAWDKKGHPDKEVSSVGKLADCYKDKDKMKEMLVLLRKQFLDAVPSLKNSTMDSDTRVKAQDTYNARNALLGRATILASILMANDVGLSEYNDQLGIFAVHRALFKPAGAEWTGIMARYNDTTKFLLNGRVFSVEYENKKDPEKTGVPGRVAASFDAVKKVWMPPKPRADAANAGQGDDGEAKASNLGLGQLFMEIHAILFKSVPSDEPVDYADVLNEKELGAANAVMQWFQENRTKFGPTIIRKAS